jgi:hypothetical protein
MGFPADFQLLYARHEWAAERETWRAVIQLNLVRNVNDVVDVLTEAMLACDTSRPTTPSPVGEERWHDSFQSTRSTSVLPASVPVQFSEKHRLLKLRLGPLRRIQGDLEQRVGPGSTEIPQTSETTVGPFGFKVERKRITNTEFGIHSNNGWKTALDRFRHVGAPYSRQVDEVTEVISRCAQDMKALWEYQVVQSVLSYLKTRMEETPGL